MDNTKKIKHLSHTDADGVGCVVASMHIYGKNNVDAEYCTYKDVNSKVKDFLESEDADTYDKIFITDISVNEEVAELIQKSNLRQKIQLIDHHVTAEGLNKYDWASVNDMKTFRFNHKDTTYEKSCGTYNFFIEEIFSNASYIPNYYYLKEFCNIIRKYDCWLWKDLNEELPKKYNNLLYIMGRDAFIDTMLDKIKKQDLSLNKTENLLLEIEENNTKHKIKAKNKRMTTKNILGYNAGIVFAESHISEIGSKLLELNPEIDFIAIINIDTEVISYRTTKDRNVNVSEIAKYFGGGGHAQASGSHIDKQFKEHILNLLLETGTKKELDKITTPLLSDSAMKQYAELANNAFNNITPNITPNITVMTDDDTAKIKKGLRNLTLEL